MKLGLFGWILGSAAALVLSGCADDEERYSTVTSESGYYASSPTYVEPTYVGRRPVYGDVRYRGIGDRGIDRVGYRDERRQIRRSARRLDRRY